MNGPAPALQGVLHIFLAYDWGEEIDLANAGRLTATQCFNGSQRGACNSTLTYRPAPLRIAVEPIPLELGPIPVCKAAAEATIFDFGAMSMALHVPFELTKESLRELAAALSDPEPVQSAARRAAAPLFDKLQSAVLCPRWSDLAEEYFVFELSPTGLCVDSLLETSADWLAALVRLDAETLIEEEREEALRSRIRYGHNDLLLADWAAAVLVGRHGRGTLEVIEFANLQLLEFREIDKRLDDQLTSTYAIVHQLARHWLPLWRPYTAQLRALGELKVEANGVFERTQNVLKLVGDQYQARVYRLLAAKFHLDVWQAGIQRSLDVVEGAYQVLADQAAAWRLELLELMIVLLIAVEVALTLMGY